MQEQKNIFRFILFTSVCKNCQYVAFLFNIYILEMNSRRLVILKNCGGAGGCSIAEQN
jgi:hypothetical protein